MLVVAESRLPEAIRKAFNGAFQHIVQRRRSLTALRMRAFTPSIGLVPQFTFRISTSQERKGTISAQASDHSLIRYTRQDLPDRARRESESRRLITTPAAP